MTERGSLTGIHAPRHSVSEVSQSLPDEKRLSLYSVLHDIERGYPSVLEWAHAIVEQLQMLGLSLSPYHPWGRLSVWVLRVLFVLHVPFYDDAIFPVGIIATFVICAIVVTVLLVAVIAMVFSVFAHRSEEHQTEPVFSPVVFKCCSHVIHFLTSVAFMPLLGNFMSVAYCQHSTLAWFSSTECSSGLGVASRTVGGIGFGALALVALITQATLCDMHPLSFRLRARAVWELDTLLVAIQVVTVALLHHFHANNEMVYHAVFVAISTFVLSGMYVLVFPYISRKMQRMRVAGLLTCCFASVFSACSHSSTVSASYEDAPAVDLLIVLLLFPALWVSFYFWGCWRESSEFSRAVTLLQAGIIESQKSNFPLNLPKDDHVCCGVARMQKEILSEHEASSSNVEYENGPSAMDYHFTVPFIAYIVFPSDVELSTRFLRWYTHITRMQPTPHMLAFTARIYTKGVFKYPNSTQVRYHFASFLARYAGRARMALEQLDSVLTADSFHPLRFQAWKLRHELRADQGAAESMMKLEVFSHAEKKLRESLGYIADFWGLLGAQPFDRGALSNVTHMLKEAKAEAFRSLRYLLQQTPQNLNAVCSFAVYLETVALDRDSAHQYLQYLRDATDPTAAHLMSSEARQRSATFQPPIEMSDSEEKKASSVAHSRRNAVRGVLIVAALLLIGVAVQSIFFAKETVDYVTAMYEAGRLRSLSVQAGAAAQRYVALSAGNATNASVLLDAKYELLGLAKDFRSLHNDLLYAVGSISSSEHVNLLSNPALFHLNETTMGLWSLGHLVANALRDVAERPLSSVQFYWIVDELPQGVSSALNRSAVLFGDDYNIRKAAHNVISAVLLGLAGLAFMTVGALLLVASSDVYAAKSEVFDLFQLIPRATSDREHADALGRAATHDTFVGLPVKEKVDLLVSAGENGSKAGIWSLFSEFRHASSSTLGTSFAPLNKEVPRASGDAASSDLAISESKNNFVCNSSCTALCLRTRCSPRRGVDPHATC